MPESTDPQKGYNPAHVPDLRIALTPVRQLPTHPDSWRNSRRFCAGNRYSVREDDNRRDDLRILSRGQLGAHVIRVAIKPPTTKPPPCRIEQKRAAHAALVRSCTAVPGYARNCFVRRITGRPAWTRARKTGVNRVHTVRRFVLRVAPLACGGVSALPGICRNISVAQPPRIALARSGCPVWFLSWSRSMPARGQSNQPHRSEQGSLVLGMMSAACTFWLLGLARGPDVFASPPHNP